MDWTLHLQTGHNSSMVQSSLLLSLQVRLTLRVRATASATYKKSLGLPLCYIQKINRATASVTYKKKYIQINRDKAYSTELQ
jgi:hypothetical protein